MIHARKDYDRIQDPEGIIPDDEPVFLIRAKDKVAPAVVEAWAAMAELIGADRSIVAAARSHAMYMRMWQSLHLSKIPDMPSEARKY